MQNNTLLLCILLLFPTLLLILYNSVKVINNSFSYIQNTEKDYSIIYQEEDVDYGKKYIFNTFHAATSLVLGNAEDGNANTVSDTTPGENTVYPYASIHSDQEKEHSGGDVVYSSEKASSMVLKATQSSHGSMSDNDNQLELSDSKSSSDLEESQHSSESPMSKDQPAMDEASDSSLSTTNANERDSSDTNEANTPNDSSSSFDEPLNDAANTPLDPSAKPSFKPLSFSFLKRTGNESNWAFGPPLFLEYMNTKYKALQRKRVSQPKRRIVYEKKGTTGMAGQMIGVCDTLLLAILHDRAIQIWAPALPEGMFDFPLSNLTYQAILPSGANPFGYVPDIKHSFAHVIDFHWSREFPGIHSEVDFDAEYPKTLLIISYHPFSHEVLQLNSTKKKLAQIGLTQPKSDEFSALAWYRICMRNVFRPSPPLMELLQPYLDRIKGHYLIGMHARMGNGAAAWQDGTKFMKIKKVTSKIFEIKRKLRWRRDALFFLSTDSEKVESFFRKRLHESIIVVDDFPRMHVGKRGVNEMAVLRSFMDIYLLGQCKYLYLTAGSGFSTAGLAMNGRNPKVEYLND